MVLKVIMAYLKVINTFKNNTFTNPFYYYLWNFSLNIFPWTLFYSGLIAASKKRIQLQSIFNFLSVNYSFIFKSVFTKLSITFRYYPYFP